MILDYPGDSIDVFFNDAAHYNPNDWKNIEYFRKYIKPGGLLMGHDYQVKQFPDVAVNVRRLERELNQPVTTYPGGFMYSFRI